MIQYCVDIRERESGNTFMCVAKTTDHDKAWEWKGIVERTLIGTNLYKLYFADVYNMEHD